MLYLLSFFINFCFLFLWAQNFSMSVHFIFFLFCYFILCPPTPSTAAILQISSSLFSMPLQYGSRYEGSSQLWGPPSSPYQRSAIYISSEKGAAKLSPRYSRATLLLEVEVEKKFFSRIVMEMCVKTSKVRATSEVFHKRFPNFEIK